MKPSEEIEPEATQEATVSLRYANLVALLLPATFLLLFVPYRWIWGSRLSDNGVGLSLPTWWLSILALLIGITLHELLHAAGFLLFGRVPRSTVRFGVQWRPLAVYAHCQTRAQFVRQ